MENFNKKEIINELQRCKELMYGKEILNENFIAGVRAVLMDFLRLSIRETIQNGAKQLNKVVALTREAFPKIVKQIEGKLGKTLTSVEKSAVYLELQKSTRQAAKEGLDDAAKNTKGLVKTTADDASKKLLPAPKSTSQKLLAAPGKKSLVTKGSNITDEAGNVIVKNGQLTDLTPAIVKSESGIPKLAPGLTDDAVKPYFRKYLNAFDEPTAKAATGAAKKGSTLVGKMTEATKNLLIKSGILKNVGGKLTISWKRVLLYAILFGVGSSVVSNWFKDNGVTPVKDPSDPIVNQDPSIVDPTLSGSQDSGTSGSVNTVVSQSPSGQNRYTFDFAAVMAALNATGKCPTGYGTSGTDGTNQTSGSTDTNVITTEPDTTLSSDDYYEYISS